jgi:hypothetical protein
MRQSQSPLALLPKYLYLGLQYLAMYVAEYPNLGSKKR